MGRARTLLLAYSFLFFASSATAGESGESAGVLEPQAGQAVVPESPPTPPATEAPPGPEIAPSGKLDFDFFATEDAGSPGLKGLANPDPDFEERVHRRRWMLKTHQALGMTTWALMAATVIVGQLNYNQLYGGGGSTKWMGLHTILVIATSTTFLGAGTMAILAPKPYPKPLRFDPGLVHRIATTGATLGMLTQIGLGIFTHLRAQAGNPHERQTLARTHQIVGYSTFGLLTVAGTVWIF